MCHLPLQIVEADIEYSLKTEAIVQMLSPSTGGISDVTLNRALAVKLLVVLVKPV